MPNGLNQYQSANAKTFAYDKNDNQTRDERTTYLYDMENRLVLAGNDMELLYDPLGRLYQIGRKSGTKTYFLYDGDNLVAEYQNSVMTKRYVHGDGMQAPLISYDGRTQGWLASRSGSVGLFEKTSWAVLKIVQRPKLGFFVYQDSCCVFRQ